MSIYTRKDIATSDLFFFHGKKSVNESGFVNKSKDALYFFAERLRKN